MPANVRPVEGRLEPRYASRVAGKQDACWPDWRGSSWRKRTTAVWTVGGRRSVYLSSSTQTVAEKKYARQPDVRQSLSAVSMTVQQPASLSLSSLGLLGAVAFTFSAVLLRRCLCGWEKL